MSRISTISIKRPVLAWVMSIVIILFGLISWLELGVREYPAVDPPVITISTSYTGASADIIQREITEPIESQVNAVSGIRSLTSSSSEGRSVIVVEFGVGTDLEVAANDVRDRVSRAVEDLPDDARPPSVRKEDADSDPILFVNLWSPVRDRMELTRIGRDVFRERLRTIDGISIVSVWGQQRPVIRILMDPGLMAAYDVTPQDVRAALEREHLELPAGLIEGSDIEMTIRTMGRMSDVEEFNRLIIRSDNGRVVRLQDIGSAVLTSRDSKTILRRDGEPMVGLAAIPQPGSNQIEAADEFYRRIEEIRRELPPDIEVMTGFDTTEFIRDSIADVQQSILFAFLLVVGTLYLFLRDLRTTFIPLVVIPISILGSFFVIWLFGFTINTLTLLALILAIGLVVDDAVVVVENIYRRMEEGLPPMKAGIEGMREIFFAVIATSLALVAVFIPILFLDGVTGRLFREFGVVMTGAVVISTFVSVTLAPMLSTRVLGSRREPGAIYLRTESLFRRLNRLFASSLERFLADRSRTVRILGGVVLGMILLFMHLPEEVAPLEDRSMLNISATAPEGATFDYMDRVMEQIAEVVREHVPEARSYNSITSQGGTNRGNGFITLQPPGERKRSQAEIAAALRPELARITGARVNVSEPQTLSGGTAGLPIQFVVQTPSLERLREVIPEFLEEARNHPAFSFVDVDLKFNRPELRVEIDRDRARALGVTVSDIVQTMQYSYSGSRFGYFEMDGRQYWVQGRLFDEYRRTPGDMRDLHVRNSNGELIPVDNLVSFTESSSPPELFRFNRISSATFSASLADGYSMGEGIAAMREIAGRVLDESFSTDLRGLSREFEESVSSIYFIFLLAIVFIYLILAAQFESFRDPLIILITVPLALAGALFALWYFGQTLNIFSKIAMIMLIGMVTKNGILIVEFANQRREAGLTVSEAVRSAAVIRFRPILMTSVSTILGILPLALGIGAGAESRVPIGIVVIGGMVIGTFLTLFIIPSVYTMMAKDGAGVDGAGG